MVLGAEAVEVEGEGRQSQDGEQGRRGDEGRAHKTEHSPQARRQARPVRP